MGYLSLLEVDKLANNYYNCGSNHSIIPLIQRKYKFSFIGNSLFHSSKKKFLFRYRDLIFDQFSKQKSHIFIDNNDSYIFINDVGMKGQRGRTYSRSCKEMMEVSFNSQMILTLPGDTITTDRIILAFETLSLIGFIGTELEQQEFLRALPFPSRKFILFIFIDSVLVY